MITMQRREQVEPDGMGARHVPVVVCDKCGETLHKGMRGIYQYEWEPGAPAPGILVHLHRECWEAWDAQYMLFAGRRPIWLWNELDDYIEFLAHNFATPFLHKDAKI